jgi:hypothetical protein
MLHLLDPSRFKKYIERTYAAITAYATKNEYNCIFSLPSCASPVGRFLDLRYFVWVIAVKAV